MSNFRFAVLMALVAACAPLALDACLPGLTNMADDFAVSSASVSSVITLFIFGLSMGQLIGGPMSDRFGRRVMVLSGLSLFAIASLLIMLSHSFYLVQIGRVLQALGGGFAAVCVPAYIRDRAVGGDAAKLFALVGLIIVAAPAIAPTIGALLIKLGNWHSVFLFLGVYAIVIAALLLSQLPASSPPSAVKIPALRRYRLVIAKRHAMGLLLTQALSFSVMMVFITNASFIYQETFGLNDHTFALLFAANVALVATINRVNSRLLNRYSPQFLLALGLAGQLIAVLLLVLLLFSGNHLLAIVGLIIITIGMNGAIAPNSNALYISQFSEHTGSASALIGAGQFLVGALAGAISSGFHDGTLWPVFITMLLFSLGANLLMFLVCRNFGDLLQRD